MKNKNFITKKSATAHAPPAAPLLLLCVALITPHTERALLCARRSCQRRPGGCCLLMTRISVDFHIMLLCVSVCFPPPGLLPPSSSWPSAWSDRLKVDARSVKAAHPCPPDWCRRSRRFENLHLPEWESTGKLSYPSDRGTLSASL